MTDFLEVQKQLESLAGPEDREWYRGKPGSPYLHLGYHLHASSIELELAQKLLAFIRERKPKNLVEVGTNIGLSTSWQLLGIGYNGFGHLTTFDIKNWSTETPWIWTTIQGLPVESLTFVESSVWDGKDKLPETIDWVFIDSSHEVDQTKKELETLCPKMSVGGMMTFHDVKLCGHCGDTIQEYFSDKSYWKYYVIEEGRGLGVAERLS